jgi:hypothetical protein
MYELSALGQLVARAVLQVVPQAPGLGLSRAPCEIAVLDQVGQPSVRRIRVELDAIVGERGCDLGRGLVGQKA